MYGSGARAARWSSETPCAASGPTLASGNRFRFQSGADAEPPAYRHGGHLRVAPRMLLAETLVKGIWSVDGAALSACLPDPSSRCSRVRTGGEVGRRAAAAAGSPRGPA